MSSRSSCGGKITGRDSSRDKPAKRQYAAERSNFGACLHYVGDKLGLISRALAWLAPGGTFVAHLDLTSIKIEDDPRLIRLKSKLLANDLQYDARRRILTCRSSKEVDFGYRYLGADDTAGPNYTGQPAVNSHYKSINA